MCVRILWGPGAKSPRARQSLPSSFQSLAARVFPDRAARADGAAATPTPTPTPAPAPKSSLLGRLRLRYRLMLATLAAVTVGIGAAFAAMMVYYTVIFPNPLAMRDADQLPYIKVLARDGTLLGARGSPHEYVSLDQLPKYVQEAVVATEDRRFFVHYGVDPAGMIRAMFANLRAGRFAQGGSTLTQQLAKNLFLTSDRTLTRKFAEFGLALWLEIRLTKAEILEVYLNRVYLGGGAYGVEAASQRYFGKPAHDLTLAECAVIAGLLKAPSRYSPATNPEGAIARSRVVLAAMTEAGYISADEARRAADQKMTFAVTRTVKADTSEAYAVDYVVDQLQGLIGPIRNPLVVETSIDGKLQRAAQKIVADNMFKKGAAQGASQAALTVLDNDGGVRAVVGGRDYAESQFNRAVKGRRQPGSAFKPFVYLAALEHGLKPDSIVSDRPIAIDGWSPKNDENTFSGDITLRQALAQSVNTVAAQIYQSAGRGSAIELAQRLGIKSGLRDSPSLALGTSEVSLMELAGAYTVFANGGYSDAVHVVESVRDASGRLLYRREPVPRTRIVASDAIGGLNDMMNAVVVWGTGRRASFGSFPAGGKTGTTQDFRDAWFVGYTSLFTGGVWVGNDNGQSMNHVMGGGLPAEIWSQVMKVAHQGQTAAALPGTQISAENEPAWASPSHSIVGGVRVVRSDERLPWLDARETPLGPKPAPAMMPARELLPRRAGSHPPKSIGEDFVARALAGTDVDEGEARAAETPRSSGETPQPKSWW